MSVEPSPADSTSAPWEAAPTPNASASGAEEVRISCTVTIVWAPVIRANAAPTAPATVSSSSSGTIPRMSYALKIFAYSATEACLRRVIGSVATQCAAIDGHPSLPAEPSRAP